MTHLDKNMPEAEILALLYDLDVTCQIWKCRWVEVPRPTACMEFRTHVKFRLIGDEMVNVQAGQRVAMISLRVLQVVFISSERL